MFHARENEKKTFSGLSASHAMNARGWLSEQSNSVPMSTNQPSYQLAFQRWYRFKEAFSPQFVADVIGSRDAKPKRCIDPFGGSGTSALTCQFLGVEPETIEVNPFLGDLIEAKLSSYNLDDLISDHVNLVRMLDSVEVELDTLYASAPPTLIEPGVKGKWIFDHSIIARIGEYCAAIETISKPEHRRLFKVLLGSAIVPVSNAIISGKGRRYRKNWQNRAPQPPKLDQIFAKAMQTAIYDISKFGNRACIKYTLNRGDCRSLLDDCRTADLILFSPPYPNSFDYTDVYNLELWALGYLSKKSENRALRESTMRSHVQIARSFTCDEIESVTLRHTIQQLDSKRGELWNPNIPEMIEAYFGDLERVLISSLNKLRRGGAIGMVVGDSQYADVLVPVAKICEEFAPSLGLRCSISTPMRSMRASAQQGGKERLAETFILFERS